MEVPPPRFSLSLSLAFSVFFGEPPVFLLSAADTHWALLARVLNERSKRTRTLLATFSSTDEGEVLAILAKL